MLKEIVIRHYRTDDFHELRQMVGELHDALCPFDPDLAPTHEILDQYVAYLTKTSADTCGTVFVAEQEDQLLGYVWLFGSLDADKDEHDEQYTVVSDLYVRPEARGQDVGRLLMERAEAYARSRGARKLELKVLANNLPARNFYERIGYSERVIILVKRLELS